MAVIILKGADFSQNNVGKMEIEFIISERTKAICAAYGRDFNQTQQIALQNLVDWLDNQGILENLDCLYMPCLANSLDKAFVNVAKTPYAVDIIPGSDIYTLTGKGIKANSVPSNGLLIDNISKAIVNDCHVLWYNTEEYINKLDVIRIYYYDSSLSNNMEFVPLGDSNHFTFGSQTTLCGHNIIKPGLNNQNADLGSKPSLKGINLNKVQKIDSSPGIYLYNPEKSFSALKGDNTDIANWTEPLQKFYIDKFVQIKSHALISVGKGMTDEQVIKYNDYIKALLECL